MQRETRIIIAGGRDFIYRTLLEGYLDKYIENLSDNDKRRITIISGGARGADTLGERYAKAREYSLIQFPANWDKYGKRAGYIRNAEMAKYAVADGSYGVLFAFWDCESKGTENMIETAEKYGLEVHVISY